MVAVQSSLAGVAAGRHKDQGLLRAAQILFGFHQQFRHQLQGVILEGTGGAVPQLQRVGIPFHRSQITGLAAEGFPVGPAGSFGQEVLRIVGQIFFDDGSCHGRIIQLTQRLHIHLREAFRHEQTALIGQALCDRFRRSHLAVLVSGTEKLHRCRSFFRRRTRKTRSCCCGREALCPYISHRGTRFTRGKRPL